MDFYENKYFNDWHVIDDWSFFLVVHQRNRCGKAGVTPFDMNNALAKCRYEVRAAKVEQNERNAMVSDCMESQRFRYTDY
ncbi:MAG: hypothetical protein U1F13_03565 [Acinetobacter parvus]